MQTWTIRKPQIETQGGVVAAQHFGAAQAGSKVLDAGGNAMDAAIVTALVLSTAEPWLSGIGGGGFLLHADGKTGAVETLDFNVVASRHLSAEDYPLRDGEGGNWFNWPGVKDDRNLRGYSSICIPGSIDGFAAALERHGSISFADALEPAIEAAERGLEIDWYSELCLSIDAQNLMECPASAAVLLEEGGAQTLTTPDGARYRPMKQKAETLRRLAKVGARDFYEGEIARAMVDDLAEGGSPIRLDDLQNYRSFWAQPATGSYRDLEICTIDGLSGGPSLLEAFSTLSSQLNADDGPGAGASLAYARAIRSAYENRLKTMGHASAGGDCTTHISVVDRNGNMVSLTNTLLSRFGSKVTLPKTGFLMNNGMMWFDPRPGVPNRIAPGARPLANMSPVIARRAGSPVLSIGAAGGRQIFPTLLQLISYLTDFGMSLEEAFHAPRIDASTPTIRVNRTAPADTAARIAAFFPVEQVSDTLYPVNFAIPSAVMRDPSTGENFAMAHPTNPWAFPSAQTENAAALKVRG